MSQAWAGYVEGFRRRASADRAALLAARAQARDGALRAARTLRASFDLRRVLIIGSVQRDTYLSGSDIDLAVEGLPSESVAEAERIASEAAGLPVDVLRLEQMQAGWRTHHERFGEPVDE